MESSQKPTEDTDAIFHAALQIMDRAERESYLNAACGADSDLRQRIESLLEADCCADDFFRTAQVRLEHQPLTDEDSDGAGSIETSGVKIGRYRLLQQIGEGGFGTVWMAEQLEPVKRKVALKIIKLGMDTREVIARFEAERQALAMMDHPNIAKVLDGGATESGRPFFVMELVRGISITRFCDEQSLNTEERLKLFIDVCKAVQHAHQKGIIHRDLKPSNVMVTMHDDEAVPKVIDFGVAKATQTELTDKTLYTRYEQFIGTPAYMSPEQAQMSGLDIDTRSDIYSLGVLLYELLTGNTPFDSRELLKAGYDEIRRVIREEEPPKPSTRVNTLNDEALTDLARYRKASPDKLEGMLRGDLDWIIMMALEKDRTRRYETATGLAKDIQRHLTNEPVTAGAPGTAYRVAKYVRRNRKALLIASGFATFLLVAGTLVIWQGIALWKIDRYKKENALRIETRKLNRQAVALQNWGIVRTNLAEFLEDQKHNNNRTTVSLDGIKLAAICLIEEDYEGYEEICARMVGEHGASSKPQNQEHTVRAYFSVPRSPDDPEVKQLLNLAAQIEMKTQAWADLGRGMAGYRMGTFQSARDFLSGCAKLPNLYLQVAARPYLAMACHRLGDGAAAERYLRGAEQALAKLEGQEVGQFWHERVLGRLALKEATELIEGGE